MMYFQQNYVGKQVIIQMNAVVNFANIVTNAVEVKIKTNRIGE